jgi:hypothetical protein
MSAYSEPLLNVLGEWRDSSIAESNAIKEERWTDLNRIQDSKVHLQRRIRDCYGNAPADDNPGLDPLVRAMVAELIQLERFNGTLLAEKRKMAEVERDQIEGTSKNLRRIQRYAGAGQTGWAAYS